MTQTYEEWIADWWKATLGELMEDVCQRCYRASWLVGHGEALPDLVKQAVETGQPVPYGDDAIQPGEAAHILEVAHLVGGWVEPLDEGGWRIIEGGV